MREKNVCKFISDGLRSGLKTVHFVMECDPTVQARATKLTACRALLVFRGSGSFRFGYDSVSVGVGDLVFAFPSEVFSAEGNGLEFFYIGFEGQRAEDLFRRYGISSSTRRFSGHESQIPFWKESILRATQENLDLVSESVLMYAFSRLTNVSATVNDVSRRMTEFAEDNFSDPDLSLRSLAAEWGYSEKYLSDAFKKHTGIGFSAYLKNLRLKHALLLMDHGVESVKNVAFLCGFRDPLYFSKVFRESMGLSPKEYKNRSAKTDPEP